MQSGQKGFHCAHPGPLELTCVGQQRQRRRHYWRLARQHRPPQRTNQRLRQLLHTRQACLDYCRWIMLTSRSIPSALPISGASDACGQKSAAPCSHTTSCIKRSSQLLSLSALPATNAVTGGAAICCRTDSQILRRQIMTPFRAQASEVCKNRILQVLGAYAASSPFAAGHLTAVGGLQQDGDALALWQPQALAVRHALAPQSRTAAGHGHTRSQALELFGPALEPFPYCRCPPASIPGVRSKT